MLTERIFLIGAGGHGLVVLDALLRAGQPVDSVSVMDESAERVGKKLLDYTIERLYEDADLSAHRFHVCIGNNIARERMFGRIAAYGATPQTVIHFASIVAASATIGENVFVAATAVVGPSATVGAGAIINHSAIVDHDCCVGRFCHVAPGVTLGGNVRMGARVFLGAGVNVLPGVTIGEDVIVGAGAVVTADVPPGTTYVGVPAHRIR
jgi:sugar O-acyltransferase (sialic acid O-acetyltransferase NeuD family)